MDPLSSPARPALASSSSDLAAARALEHDAAHVADAPPAAVAEGGLGGGDRPGGRWSRYKSLAKWLIAAAVVYFVAAALWGQLAEADFSQVAFRGPWVVAACGVLVGLYVSLMLSERMLLRAFTGSTLPWRQMMGVAWVPLAGKYVPGKFAAVAGAVLLLRRAGVPTAPALSVFLVLDSLPILTGTVLGALLLMAPEVRSLVPVHPAALVTIAVVAAGCVHPAVFGRLMNLGLRLLRRPPLPRVPTLRDYLGPILTTLGQWGSNAGAVFLMCVAFAPEGEGPGLAQLPAITGITALVMVVSYFSAVIVPQGYGVREGIFIPLLAAIVPLPAATAAAVAMRLAHTFVEILLCGVGLALLRGTPAGGAAPAMGSGLP